MNFTLNDINCFIETEKRKEVFPRAVFKTIAVTNFCDTPIEELMATFEVCMYVKAPQWSSKASSYQEFRHILEDGQIDILQMTSRQRLLFLTCLSDSTFKQKMMANLEKLGWVIYMGDIPYYLYSFDERFKELKYESFQKGSSIALPMDIQEGL